MGSRCYSDCEGKEMVNVPCVYRCANALSFVISHFHVKDRESASDIVVSPHLGGGAAVSLQGRPSLARQDER